MKITEVKQLVNNLKKDNGKRLFLDFIQNNKNKQIFSMLKHIGKLPPNFDGSGFIKLLNNKNEKIRILAVKNIGKLTNKNYLIILMKLAKEDKDSMVRREAISAIGRMKSRNALPFLTEILKNKDPKIVLQSIRALLYFKKDNFVRKKLLNLKHHPNEVINSIINEEFFLNKFSNKKDINHTKFPDYLKNVIVQGDVIKILEYLPDESIHLTFTSPPYYNARDYSTYQSYKEYLNFLNEVFKEVYRVTKEGRFFILNTSPIIIPRVSRKHSSKRYPIPFDIHPYLIKMGWEFIEDIVWIKPEFCVKNRNGGFMQHRKPLAYKPNVIVEYVMVYRKKTNRLIDWNIKQYNSKIIKESKINEKYETNNVWKINPTSDKVHSAVFPEELCNKIIKYYSFKGDLIFDPFAGSGTLGKAAAKNGRYFFLTEIKQVYIDRILENIESSSLISNKIPKIYKIKDFNKIVKNAS